ncbi:MAG: hypothetical protein ACRD10_14485 [Terriglobia bacterium]
MEIPHQDRAIVTVILGAGASRDVSYAYATGQTEDPGDVGPTMPSPLDNDFFDLIQRLRAQMQDGAAKEAMGRIVDKALNRQGDAL